MGNQTDKITQLQIYMLFTLYLFTTILGFRMSTLVAEARFSAWVSLLCGSLIGLIITYLCFRLAMKRPQEFFGFYGKRIVGSWLHYPLVLIIIFSTLFSASYILREIQDFIVEVYLPETPEWAVALVFGICIAYAVRSGVQTIFRCAQGIFFFSILSMIIVPLFVSSEMKWDMFPALFNHFDASGIWNGTYLTTALYGEMGFIIFLFPYFANEQRTMRSISWATITSLIIIFSSLIPVLFIFGPYVAGNLNYPELELIRFIRAGAFLENLDPVLLAVWLTSVFIKISMLTYIAVILLTHTFSLADHKPFSFSVTAVMIGQALFMVRSHTELSYILLHGGSSFLLFAQAIPIFYLLVDAFRTRWGTRYEKLSQKN
ncbi:GerAB/ArcD/ProY family transporter [Brevibacillus panacihumi]|uniref:GerAB/ArcD/ProY family transporter n=1 Tax=Brevibacillus panacihumi TaxID=497735 RepID=UPI003CFCDBC1